MRKKPKHSNRNPERGVALIFALFTLLLLSAIAAGLVFMTNTETGVNSNYRSERVSAFAAQAGIEEVRDRMPALNTAAVLPTTLPPAAGSVLYVLNEGAAAGTVQPWTAGNAYMDDEMCHDFAGVQGQQPASNVRCTTSPATAMLVPGTLASPVTSNYPWSGTAAALPYKWVRVTLKESNSVQNYPVNGASTTQVCWNGSNEVLLSGAATCQGMAPSANPVYMVTSLAVSSSGKTRKMVQAEVALSPAQPFPYGLFATGTSCPALTFSGGGNTNPATDSYNSAKGGTYNTTQSPTQGDVGANGGVSLTGHAQIGGAVAVPSTAATPPAATNPCAGAQGDYNTTGSAGTYLPATYPGNVLQQAGPYIFPAPPNPSPVPTPGSPIPSASCTPPASGICAVPGTYGAISLSGKTTLTLAPGVYNIYSLSISGQASVTVNPAGAVVLNFPSTSPNPISVSGQGISSSSLVPNDFQVNYGGTGTVSLSGNGASYAVVDAPNAGLTVSGNGDFYGRVIGKTINYSGNGKFHFDKNSALGPQSNGGYALITFREISY
jgi:Tfp pilus assembly protein PilX